LTDSLVIPIMYR